MPGPGRRGAVWSPPFPPLLPETLLSGPVLSNLTDAPRAFRGIGGSVVYGKEEKVYHRRHLSGTGAGAGLCGAEVRAAAADALRAGVCDRLSAAASHPLPLPGAPCAQGTGGGAAGGADLWGHRTAAGFGGHPAHGHRHRTGSRSSRSPPSTAAISSRISRNCSPGWRSCCPGWTRP